MKLQDKILLVSIGLAFAASFRPIVAQDKNAVLLAATQALGASEITAIRYSGRGEQFLFGQAPNSDASWPRVEVTSYSATVDYDLPYMRTELFRRQGENPPRGGGPQPILGQQLQIQLVNGPYAWNLAGVNPVPVPDAVDTRQLQLWMTPYGFLKAARANNATISTAPTGGTLISFTLMGRYKVNGTINGQNLIERVETSIDDPVLGDMPMEFTYQDYRDYEGRKFPGRIVEKDGGYAVLDLTIDHVSFGGLAVAPTPPAVTTFVPDPPRVAVQVITDGVWFFTGGTHNSVAVEFKDHIVMIEGPLNEARSLAVIAQMKRLAPSKPIKYLVNTHQHFDHSGGIRTYIAEGATIITHETYKPYYERILSLPRTLNPDRLSQSDRRPVFETMTDRRVLTDGSRVLELHLVQGNLHNDAMLMAYLPTEKLLIEADVFNPPPPNALPPAVLNPFTVNLVQNLGRLGLDVERIAPIHGRLATMGDLKTAVTLLTN